MVRIVLGSLGLSALLTGILLGQPLQPLNDNRPEPVAETRLLMEGLASSNFRGLDGLLERRPADLQSWTFIRGQALLLAETGNLLLLRPPNNRGQQVWLQHAGELRRWAKDLAIFAADQDYVRSRKTLENVATACNRCHQAFRVQRRVKVSEVRE